MATNRNPKSFARAPARRVRRSNGDVLRALIDAHALRAVDIANLCRVSHAAAKSWRLTVNPRPIPDCALELLAMKCGEVSPFKDHLRHEPAPVES